MTWLHAVISVQNWHNSDNDTRLSCSRTAACILQDVKYRQFFRGKVLTWLYGLCYNLNRG